MPSRGIPVQLRPPRGGAQGRSEEAAARKRVAALVSGGLHFKIKREGDHVQAARGGAGPKLWSKLTSKMFTPEHTLDLRELAPPDLAALLADVVPLLHRRGVKHLLLQLTDASKPAQDGAAPREGRLDAAIEALRVGAAAPLVRAFASAHEQLGGSHALAVMLV